jgi:putative LysE/RhtB family amino acid efflux pump
MSDPFLFAKGIALGVAIAAPVGPIGILCIRRTLVYGRRIGFLTGIGAALADGVFGAIAAFGLAALSGWLLALSWPLRLIGGIVLLILAVRTLMTAGAVRRDAGGARPVTGDWSALGSSFLLTLSNPMAILTFATIFTGVGIAEELSVPAGVVLVAGVVLGSIGWWLTLSLLVGAAGGRVTHRTLLWIDRVAGVLLLAFAAYALGSLLVF